MDNMPKVIIAHGEENYIYEITAVQDPQATYEQEEYLEEFVEELPDPVIPQRSNFFCEVCDKTFKSRRGLVQHKKLHDKVARFLCADCNQTFSRRVDMERHYKSECNTSRFFCNFCGFKCFDPSELYTHQITAHTTKHKPLKFIHCPKCTMSFREQDAYDIHKTYHDRLEETEPATSENGSKADRIKEEN